MRIVRLIWPAVSVLAGCVRTHNPTVAPSAPAIDGQAVVSIDLTAERTAAFVRMALATGADSSRSVSLSRHYLCIDAAGRECSGKLEDTVPRSLRSALRQQVRHCNRSPDHAPTLVQISVPQIRGDSLYLYVSLTSGDYGQPGEQATFRVRGATKQLPPPVNTPELSDVYHGQIIRGHAKPATLPDDTCPGQG